ncbi:MAG: DUF5106 domain-containing protein [Muribaculaceae bacterium]|nr:DUF5106 domain-containing protein [Muribaculaceae bacterium]
MKRLILHIFLLVTAIAGVWTPARAASGDLFLYPSPPDTLMALQPRCDYIVSRFWDRCNFGTAFRDQEKLNRAFGDWVTIMQHASADTVHASIDHLLQRFVKKGPETLTFATMAENWLYSDTCSIFSEEMYLPFARAAANHKKISNADKARFQLHTKIIESSGLGAFVPDLVFTRPDGTKGRLSEITGSSVLLFINDPDCSDCNMARVRLSADYNANELIRRGELAIVSIYPDEASAEWRQTAATYPSNWTVGAIEDADSYFDLRSTPSFYFLNTRHKVLAKDIDIDYLLGAFRVANTQRRTQ